MSDATLSARLAAHWAGVTWGDLDPVVVHATRRALLDTLAAGLAGADSAETRSATAGMAALHPADAGDTGAGLWGQARRMPATAAALVNGTTAHARELDDFDGCGHTGAVVVPAVLAVAETVGADGRTVLRGIAAGYDVAARMLEASGGYKAHNGRGWHSTATCGTFGAAMAAAAVLGLDAATTTHALGIAGTYVGGVWAFMADGAMTKRLHPGKAAEAGVAAAFLARAGMTGPAQILESSWGGFFPTYAGEAAVPDRLLQDLGRVNGIAWTGIKPYACCRGAHAGIDALQQLMRSHGFAADAIERIVVHGNDYARRLVGNKAIRTVLDAQMSLPYALAVTAVTGRADLPQFDPPLTTDPRVADLLARTEVVADRELALRENPPVEVVLRDGRRLQAQVEFAKGDPRNPVSDEELRAKARSLVVPVLGEGRFRQIVEAVDALDGLADIRPFAVLLRP